LQIGPPNFGDGMWPTFGARSLIDDHEGESFKSRQFTAEESFWQCAGICSSRSTSGWWSACWRIAGFGG
jgi:hypothetical protein